MKKYVSLYLSPLVALPILGTISCQATDDKKTMNWSIDPDKVKNIKNDDQKLKQFNEEAISLEKLKKVVKYFQDSNQDSNNSNDFFERYTIDAIDNGWFESMSFDQNKILIIKLKNSKEINGKTVNCPYLLPNGSLELRY